jgi:hypothetical protein
MAVYQFLLFLHVLALVPDGEVNQDGESVPASEWAHRFIAETVGGHAGAARIRHPSLAALHAYVLRLAVHACSGPRALSELMERVGGDLDRLSAEWASNVLIASERLSSFVTDRFRDPFLAMHAARSACERIGFDLAEPGRTGDRLNPMVYGPGLVDHERWVLLHALDVAWEVSGSGELPVWWSNDVRDALAALVNQPDPYESSLFREDDRNGLRSMIDRTPSRIAAALLDRAGGR